MNIILITRRPLFHETARRNKDAAFNSDFDMNVAQEVCVSNNPMFSQRMGRLLGTKKTVATSTEPKEKSYMKMILEHPQKFYLKVKGH